ncbi:serpin B5-like [Uranotaenia lowii]|uniref:serpin B5-like n=1 Tax=Uranotaenia lowii TaxID=190385 RepID=UPI00247A24A7|nr:serpin B5-like [Uranotaenia lowii]
MTILFLIALLTYSGQNQNTVRSPHVLMQTLYDLRVISDQSYTAWFHSQPDYHRYVIPDLEFRNRTYDHLSVINVGVHFSYGSVDYAIWDTAVHWIAIYYEYSVNYVVGRINRKFNELSNGEIDRFMDNLEYNYDSYISLFSLVTFKPVWKHGFSNFHSCNFKTTTNVNIMTNFMQSPVLELKYGINNNFKAVELPLENQLYSLLLLLPLEGKNVDDYIKSIDTQGMIDIYKQLNPTNVSVLIPRNNFDDSHDSKQIFNNSLNQKPFEDRIFRPVRDQDGCPVFEMTQRLKVVFDTNGVENATSSGSLENSKVFLANRPFWFLLVERRVNVLLMIGHIRKPGVDLYETGQQDTCPEAVD